MNNAPIGVFDSGVGGLTVAREIMRQLPSEDIIYFGDTARVPYGSKSRETIIRYSRQIIHFLLAEKVKAVVIACNTASSLALDTVKNEFAVPIVGVVWPGAIAAAATTKNNRVGVIGTVATVESGIYTQYLKQLNPKITVFGKACPLFVPLVEEGMLYDPVTVEMADRYTSELMAYNIDTLVLGCTHYPLIRHTIQKVVGDGVSLVNPAYETAQTLKETLQKGDLANDPAHEGKHRFYVSDGAEKFRAFANTILPCDVEETRLFKIE